MVLVSEPEVAVPELVAPVVEPCTACVVSDGPELPTEPESEVAPPVFELLLQADRINPPAINSINLIFFMIKEVFKLKRAATVFCLSRMMIYFFYEVKKGFW